MKKIVFLIVLGCLASCRDFLDIKPRNQVVPKTVEEFSALIHDILYELDDGTENIVGNIDNSYALETVMDNLDGFVAPNVSTMKNYIGDILGDGNVNRDYYSKYYEYISRCNMVFDNMEEKDSRAAEDLLAATYALRGVCYYNLLKTHCDMRDPDVSYQLGLPIVDKFDMEAKPQRSSLMETIGFIEGDFNKALSLDNQNAAYRFNNDIVKGYLARLYFWVGMYDKAIAPAEEILAKYPMLTGSAYLDMMKNQTGKSGTYLIKPTNLAIGIIGNMPDKLRERPLTKNFVDLFVENENDIRYGLTALMTRQNWRICVRPIQCGLRSDEMCLILAESYYHEGNTDKALEYLNLIRSMRITGNVDYTMATLPAIYSEKIVEDSQGNVLTPLISAILCERRKEFFLENGDRFFELKRNGRPEWWTPRNGQKLETKYFMYTFPFSHKDTVLIEGFVQNPGYESVQ